MSVVQMLITLEFSLIGVLIGRFIYLLRHDLV